jgi:hypothetical protein
MANGQIALAFTVKVPVDQYDTAVAVVGQGTNQQGFATGTQDPNLYWWFFLSNQNPLKLVYQLIVPGTSNSTVPSGIDSYMSNPDLIFGVVTQQLGSIYLPQGDLYNYLATYGASDGLQMLEQANSSLGCGYLGSVGYAMVGQGGPRNVPFPPPTYEVATIFNAGLIEVSLVSQPNGQPPYGIVDEYTF